MKGLAVLAAGLGLAAVAIAAPPLQPSPDRPGAMPPGPAGDVKLTEAYAKLVGRDAYFWAWPMLASYGRRIVASKTHELVMAGPLPQAPLNYLGMLTDTIDPAQRTIASPDQDLIWGIGVLALDISPVVLQVPHLGERLWFYQCVDARGDSFAKLGSMYEDSKGTFLLVGPGWKGETPKGIKRVFRSSTNTGTVVARIYYDGTPQELRWLQNGLEYVAMYPLSDYDGTMKSVAWRKLPSAPASKVNEGLTDVDPQLAFDVLADVLEDAPPLPGEEARYAQVLAVLHAAEKDPKLKQAMIQGAKEAEQEIVKPLFAHRSFGRQLPHHWNTIDNAGAYGTDYFMRTAAARANGFTAPPAEVTVYDLETDAKGNRLDGVIAYTIVFAKDKMPPGAVWSLTAYDESRLFEPNALKRYALGSKSTALKPADNGSLTIYVQAEPPAAPLRENWLPAPRGGFSLVLRVYAPKGGAADGNWTPPPVVRVP